MRTLIAVMSVVALAGAGCKSEQPPAASTSGEAAEPPPTAARKEPEPARDVTSTPIEPGRRYRPEGFKSLDSLPEGPVLGESYVDDPALKTIGDLGGRFTLPPGYHFDVTPDGQPVIRRDEDGASFSILLEEGILTIDLKRVVGGRARYDTSEFLDAEPPDHCDVGKRFGKTCVTGFAGR